MHAITLVIIYNYVLFDFRSNIIFIILYDLQYSDLCVYLIRDPGIQNIGFRAQLSIKMLKMF